jgi:hypothetical protein
MRVSAGERLTSNLADSGPRWFAMSEETALRPMRWSTGAAVGSMRTVSTGISEMVRMLCVRVHHAPRYTGRHDVALTGPAGVERGAGE